MTTFINNENEKNEVIALVLAAQAGERDAIGQLFERFERQVFAIALRRLNDYGEAQELVQDVFMQTMRKIGQLREPAAFAGWLKSITVRLAINRGMRRRAVTATEPDTLAATCVENTTPMEIAITSERATTVRSSLKRLRTLDRETLVAFYINGRSLLEMSEEFDAPVGTIKRRLHVARKRLAEEVEAAGCGAI